MNEFKFKIASGDRPTVSDSLWVTSANGACDPSQRETSFAYQPLDLTGRTVKLLFQGPGVQFSQPASIIDPLNGRVQYHFNAGETDVAGDYYGEWQVIDPDGSVTTHPPEGFA
ncbi:MAG: BppU family phage baseplate upper protein, partial [Patescibacteria group bacterium]|nr:BppU family phage baseplate upper protein [Patescibacteria group bacterium]